MPLPIHIKAKELYDDAKGEFVEIEEETILLEHSLFAISLWESKYHLPFISTNKSSEQLLDYMSMMAVSPPKNPNFIFGLSDEQVKQIVEYIDNPMTATWFSDDEEKKNKRKDEEIVTSELIYYWIASLQLSMEVEHWHINRLMTLIRVCSAKNAEASKDTSKKKGVSSDYLRKRKALNAQRKNKFNTKG